MDSQRHPSTNGAERKPLQPRHVNYWCGKRVYWRTAEGKRSGLVVRPKKVGGKGSKSIQLYVATDDGWMVYLTWSPNSVHVVENEADLPLLQVVS